MNREDIIRMAKEAWGLEFMPDYAVPKLERLAALVAADEREQIIAANATEIEKINAHIKALEAAVLAERKKVAAWMMQRGYATGHGDTTEDLLKELEWQVRESEREQCAKVCEDMEEKAEGTECCKWPTPIDCASAIRARGQA